MQRAGDILKEILKDEMYRRGKAFSSFFRAWEMIVGKTLADHSKVLDIQKNILIIMVDHPGWLQLLYINKAKILRRIKKLYPDLGIKHMKIRIGILKSKSKKVIQKTDDKKVKSDNDRLNANNDYEFEEILNKLNASIIEKTKKEYKKK